MEKCPYCGRLFEQTIGRGRPKLFCSSSCTTRASIIRRVKLETLLRLRPDIRRLLDNAAR
jgi:hypothetical protein